MLAGMLISAQALPVQWQSRVGCEFPFVGNAVSSQRCPLEPATT